MSEDKTSASEAHRPSGKRQLAGAAAVAAKVENKEVDQRRGNIFARFAEFIRSVISEIRKVIWPTVRQMVTYTAVVLAFLIIITAIVAGVDFLTGKGVAWVLTRS